MKRILQFVATGMVAVVLAVACGCDTEPVSDTIYITPDSVAITKGQSIEFTVTGGYDYEWSLSDDSLGQLSTRRGGRTVYTSLYEASETVGSNGTETADQPMQVLTCRSYIPYGTSADTNGVINAANNNQNTYGATAEAYIRHM